MLNDSQITILILSLISLLNLTLVAVMWFALKRRNTGQNREQTGQPNISPASVKQIEEKALRQLEWRVAAAVRDFDQGLSQSTGQLNQKLTSLVANVIDREMAAYKQELEKARSQATKTLEQVQAAADELHSKQRAEMTAEIEEEKKRLADKLDQKLSDIMSTYLIESLGKDIDLGAQSKYLLATLDKHKQKLKEDILGEY